MKASIEIKADVLKTLIVEDREEMRGIRLMIYNVITLFLTASFVATAFLFERFKWLRPSDAYRYSQKPPQLHWYPFHLLLLPRPQRDRRLVGLEPERRHPLARDRHAIESGSSSGARASCRRRMPPR